MTSQVCIPASMKDPYYRYKRDILLVVYEHKHGIQTRIANIDAISRQLKVPREDLPKLFKKKLGVSITKDVIPGRIEVRDLEAVLNTFIEDKVLCKKCRYPELSGDKCNACGASISDKPVKSKKTLSLEEEEIEDVPVSDLDLKVAKVMHELYAVREHFLPTRDDIMSGIILTRTNEYLDQCWTCTTKEKLKDIKAKTTLFGQEIDSGIVSPSVRPRPVRPASSPNLILKSTVKEEGMLQSMPELTREKPKAPKEKKMMLGKHKTANDTDLFQIPFGQGELTSLQIKEQFPDFSTMMDGVDLGGSLLLYYELNPLRERYEFRDGDAEADIGEFLKMDFHTMSAGESKHDEESRKAERK